MRRTVSIVFFLRVAFLKRVLIVSYVAVVGLGCSASPESGLRQTWNAEEVACRQGGETRENCEIRLVELRATVQRDAFLAQLTWTTDGWKMASNPLEAFDQSTPAGALRSFYLSLVTSDWENLLLLSPPRLRVGLDAARLQSYYSQSSVAIQIAGLLEEMRDNLRRIPTASADVARLDLPSGRAILFEMHAGLWYVSEVISSSMVPPT